MDRTSIIESLFTRKSVRAYTDEPVSPEDELAILEAACQAPTAGNQQLYTIIVVRDHEKKIALQESCDGQPFIGKAPLVLVFCADVRRWYQAFLDGGTSPRDPGVGDMLLAFEDAVIAAQNAVVAAESLGLGSCYIGDVLEHKDDQRAILGLPRYVMPAAMLTIGHPTEQQRARRKPPRFDLSQIVFENEYRELPAYEVAEAIKTKIGGPHASKGPESLQAFCDRKWNSDFSREMTRSVRAWIEDFEYPTTRPNRRLEQ